MRQGCQPLPASMRSNSPCLLVFKDIETMEIMNRDLDAYSDVIRELSSELDTDLVDLREVFMNYISKNNPNNDPSGITTSDGVHLNDQGNKLIADQMIRFIN